MANEKLRGYRRGLPYRSGDIKLSEFLKEFKFKEVSYNESYSENESKRYLNYTYDALKDLCAILNIPSNVVSLLNDKNEKPALLLGTESKGQTNFIVNKNGTLVKNWVYFLDKYLGNVELGSNSLANSVGGENTGVYSQALRPVLQVLKLKERQVDKSEITSEQLEEYRNELKDLLAQMPFKEGESLDVIATIEDSRSAFLKELTDASLNNMVSVFESNGLSLDGIKEGLYSVLQNAKTEYNNILQNNINSDLVQTDFFLSAANKNNIEVTTKYTTNLELFAHAVQAYINQKLKDIGCYNNFLVNQTDLSEISVTPEEAVIIYPAIETFFATVMPMIVEQINVEDVAEEVMNSDVDTSMVENIDKMLNEDKGKFKLTLFKKLAKDIGLKVDLGRSEKTESGVYYIYFTEGYVKYIKPAVYNNPTQKAHCINVYCGESGDSKRGYWWDYELDYNDLVKFILDLENEHRKEVSKIENQKVDKELDKFKLTEFKNTCIKLNLKVDRSETPILDKKYNIRFNKSYILYLIVPVYFDAISNKEHKIKIKTLREEIYHTWIGKLDYKALLETLLNIEREGKQAIKDETEELLKQKAKVERERDNLISTMQNVKSEYDAYKDKEAKAFALLTDSQDIKTTKDLRDRFVKYIQMSRISLGYPATASSVENVLKSNVQTLDSVDLNVAHTVIPEKALKGNSKVWSKAGAYQLLLQNRADNRKQLEGLIEGFVDIKLSEKNYNTIQKQMFRESLTFMLCKTVGLDVRTYCYSDLFDRFVKSGGENISTYLNKTFKLYNNLIVYFK